MCSDCVFICFLLDFDFIHPPGTAVTSCYEKENGDAATTWVFLYLKYNKSHVRRHMYIKKNRISYILSIPSFVNITVYTGHSHKNGAHASVYHSSQCGHWTGLLAQNGLSKHNIRWHENRWQLLAAVKVSLWQSPLFYRLYIYDDAESLEKQRAEAV